MTRTTTTLLLAIGLWAGAAGATDPTRTLETITIEGAVDVPQVLFITSRDNARFDDGLGWTFLPMPDEFLTGTELPTLIRPHLFTTDTDPAEPVLPEAKETD